MERETKTIKTPKGHTAIIKSYLTARERHAIDRKYLKDTSINQQGAGDIKLPANDLIDYGIEMIKAVVVSFDDTTENPVDKILDLPVSEFDFIQKAATEIYIGDFHRAK